MTLTSLAELHKCWNATIIYFYVCSHAQGRKEDWECDKQGGRVLLYSRRLHNGYHIISEMILQQLTTHDVVLRCLAGYIGNTEWVQCGLGWTR